MTRALVFALALAAATPAGADERHDLHQVIVLGDPGARCQFHRDGQVIASFTLEDRGGSASLDVIDVDAAPSKSDILIVCARGEAVVAQTIRFQRMAIIDDHPMCVMPIHPTGEQQRTYEACERQPRGTVSYENDYPKVVLHFAPQGARPH